MGAYPADSNVSTTLEDQPASRSFFSRFALPIRSRTRNLADFHIRPAEPHRKYAAGDHVTGAVILTILKPIRITHLTVALHGYVRVYKNPNAANEPFNPAEAPSTAPSRSSKYLGNGHASLFQDEQVLSADGRLEPGRYEFNFDLMFPSKGLPSSIDDANLQPVREGHNIVHDHSHTHTTHINISDDELRTEGFAG
ncbi:putative ph-response regulator protein palf rim8 protein [Phaeoacremonium minimum UCRPA7]|uniref:Putative ph-response regulator protein palf rim8 protein n=1 Tax=Phaeoacremonium minimum (strain UCR-PA7) TaxID=1286976 RepID=R8BMI1_PHAM7|nr:putative ph-response regulator protein palf rim8 protein [Phaeoacremonium minimum UCRPA7]EOO00564.1 putative ph-response regulator protein palf rim8 protein [Phaeoacremonium minimum UCRPA7]